MENVDRASICLAGDGSDREFDRRPALESASNKLRSTNIPENPDVTLNINNIRAA
jgi:hypothetical protein